MKKLFALLLSAVAASATLPAFAATIDLSTVTGITTLQDGDVATGTLVGTYAISIADGATVTLRNVTVNGVDTSTSGYAGITCNGNATIVLEGVNSVRGFYSYYPGIRVLGGYTLTIRGNGSLTARSNGNCSGIGGGWISGAGNYGSSCGNIVIESGDITAIGGKFCAGIGGGNKVPGGNISINGGTVNATGGADAAGIGGGYQGSCGNIMINGGTVSATGGDGAAGIGSGKGSGSICGNIVIAGGDINATGGLYVLSGAGIGSGAWAECGTIDIRFGVTRVVATRQDDWTNGGNGTEIGAGSLGTCGAVTVDPLLDDSTSGLTRTIAAPSRISLSRLTGDFRATDGLTLYGLMDGPYKITIADGATVTLDAVQISGISDDRYQWAGITCEGNATLVCKNYNLVYGFYENYPGIYVPVGKTLRIRDGGSGILEASGSEGTNGKKWAPGIGGERLRACGNIVVESGTVGAAGGSGCAGLGGGYGVACGNITISGGKVVATSDEYGAGIGSGQTGSCGSITVSGGTVEATGGKYSAGIGGGYGGSCGDIDVGEGITLVTATCGEGSTRPIGAGYGGTGGSVDVADTLGDVTSGSTRTIAAKLIDLATLEGSVTVADGYIVTGTLSGYHKKVSIADGATVTLRNVTIEGFIDSDHRWAGITCEGDATIMLEGVNVVKGFYQGYPGIYVPVGKWLTIDGEGSLTASSNGNAAGIGAGYYALACGGIIIEGGDITAIGGNSAGIGAAWGYGADCGDIYIEGGRVNATGGNNAAGIGGANFRSCGTIYIGPGIELVVATSGSGCGNPIGAGVSGTCEDVVVDGSLRDSTEGNVRTIRTKRVDLTTLTGDLAAQDGDILTGTTSHTVNIPGGATVTINGVKVTGAGGAAVPAPEFAADGASEVVKFAQAEGGKWTITAFAELANDAMGADVADGQIKVYSADTLEELKSATTPAAGAAVKEKKSAVKATVEVPAPSGKNSQFFKVKFGE